NGGRNEAEPSASASCALSGGLPLYSGGSWAQVGAGPLPDGRQRRKPSGLPAPEARRWTSPSATCLTSRRATTGWAGRLYPRGRPCPPCGRRRGLGAPRRHRAPVLAYQCPRCAAVFTAFTGTALAGTQRRPSELVLILRGIAQGTPTAQLARELGCSR